MLRALAYFWGGFLVLAAAGAVTLQVLGPPPKAPPKQVDQAPPAVAPHPAETARSEPAKPEPAKSEPPKHEPQLAEAAKPEPAKPAPPPPPPVIPVRAPGAPVPPPDPALQEPAPDYPGATLPKIDPDGRQPRNAYAAGYDPADTRPRIAILVSGLGMSEQETDEAIHALPAAISLAFSPYAPHPERALGVARASGHETLVSIPMEPQNYPINDAGNYALLARAPVAANAARLEWTLSRFAGYVGATGALGRMRGERFAGSDQMPTLLDELQARGLLYVDPRPDAVLTPTAGARRAVSLLLDEPPVRIEIETKLAQLEQIARDRGSAIGLAGGTTPVVTERLSAWAATLSQRGFALTPVSALVGAKP